MISDSLGISVHIAGDIDRPSVSIVLDGVFDGLQARRFDEVARSVPRTASLVTVDLGATTVVDSAALGALIRLRRSMKESGIEMVTVVARPFQARILEIGGLDRYLGMQGP
jgi:anti-anti-sigma factor